MLLVLPPQLVAAEAKENIRVLVLFCNKAKIPAVCISYLFLLSIMKLYVIFWQLTHWWGIRRCLFSRLKLTYHVQCVLSPLLYEEPYAWFHNRSQNDIHIRGFISYDGEVFWRYSYINQLMLLHSFFFFSINRVSNGMIGISNL